jgi:hypothetical protein
MVEQHLAIHDHLHKYKTNPGALSPSPASIDHHHLPSERKSALTDNYELTVKAQRDVLAIPNRYSLEFPHGEQISKTQSTN